MIRLLLLLGSAFALLRFARVGQKDGDLPAMVYDLDEEGMVSLAVPGASMVTLEPNTMDAWRRLASEWPEPLTAKDSFRTTTKGQHFKGKAIDVKIPAAYRAGKAGSIDWRRRFVGAAQRAGFSAFGLGYGTVHIDTGPARWWTYKQGGDVGYPAKLGAEFADRVPAEFAAAGNDVPDLTSVA